MKQYMKWKKEIIGNMTIKEIAQLAQVSSAAVSRYLNGGYISERKRSGFVRQSRIRDTIRLPRREISGPKGRG